MIPIAYVSSNINDTFEEIREIYGDKILRILRVQRTITLKDGTCIVIVTKPEDIRGMEFSQVFKSRNFYSLYEEALERIR